MPEKWNGTRNFSWSKSILSPIGRRRWCGATRSGTTFPTIRCTIRTIRASGARIAPEPFFPARVRVQDVGPDQKKPSADYTSRPRQRSLHWWKSRSKRISVAKRAKLQIHKPRRTRSYTKEIRRWPSGFPSCNFVSFVVKALSCKSKSACPKNPSVSSKFSIVLIGFIDDTHGKDESESHDHRP